MARWSKSSTELPALPTKAYTLEGVEFNPQSHNWAIRGLTGHASFPFDRLERLSDETIHRLKLAFLVLLQNKSLSNSINLFMRFKAFYVAVLHERASTHKVIRLCDILSYKGMLDRKTAWKLGVIRILLEEMERLGLGITSSEALDYFSAATIPGNIKGTSVRTRDNYSGSFTDVELLFIQSALNDGFATGDVTLTDFAISWLFLAYGVRPVQIAALKAGDLIISESDGERAYALMMPSAKRRGCPPRTSFKTRYCGKQVGTLLEQVIAENTMAHKADGLSDEDRPLFYAEDAGPTPEMRYHMDAMQVAKIVSTTLGRLTGLKANSRRFRITLAQRAVDDGMDKHTLAELLDHSDTQNVDVYYEASSAMVLRLDRHLAMELAPLAHAFAGVVVTREVDARRGADRKARIFDRSLPDNVDEALGTCGQMSFCGLAAPFACYTCRHFQPWIDGPHEAFMAALIKDRDRLEQEGYSAKIYTIRDRTILAVAEVIQACETERERTREND